MNFLRYSLDSAVKLYEAPVGDGFENLQGFERIPSEYQEVYTKHSALKVLYPFKSEREWADTIDYQQFFYFWVKNGQLLSIIGLYLGFIFFGNFLMRYRKPFKLKGAWTMWNMSLAVFSILGAIRTVPHLLLELRDNPLEYSVCGRVNDRFSLGAVGFWTTLFVLSKVPELVDTVFIVLTKRKLIFLHWYHHVTVLLYCWHSYGTSASTGLIFAAMNYSVHALMYSYYALRARGYKLNQLAPFITILQISQMVVGCLTCGMVYYYKQVKQHECHVGDRNWIASSVMYFSYFILFVVFAIKRYILVGPMKKHKKTV